MRPSLNLQFCEREIAGHRAERGVEHVLQELGDVIDTAEQQAQARRQSPRYASTSLMLAAVVMEGELLTYRPRAAHMSLKGTSQVRPTAGRHHLAEWISEASVEKPWRESDWRSEACCFQVGSRRSEC